MRETSFLLLLPYLCIAKFRTSSFSGTNTTHTALSARTGFYAKDASASEPSMTAFNAMPSVKTIKCVKTFPVATAAWFACWTSPDPLELELLAHRPHQ